MNVSVRDVREEDKEQLRQWRNQPDVAKHMNTDHYITQDEHERWFEKMQRDSTSRYWIIEYDGKAAGVACITNLDERNRRCDYGIYIGEPKLQGKGIGVHAQYFILTHVFGELGLNKLCGEVIASNKTALNMFKRFGFKEEGVRRKHVFKGGTPVDLVIIGLLREEWQAIRPTIDKKLERFSARRLRNVEKSS